jgi:hypothetical protein
MKKVYLMVYGDTTGTRETIKTWANESALVLTWRIDMPHSIYLVSESTASELSADLAKKTNNSRRFLIVEISDNRQGWLPTDTWYFLKNKAVKPKK